MPQDYLTLGQLAPGAAALTDLYTVGASTQAIAKIFAANRSATPTAIRVAIRPLGAAISNEHYIAYDMAIGANAQIVVGTGIALEATDVISVYNTLATVSFTATGVELT